MSYKQAIPAICCVIIIVIAYFDNVFTDISLVTLKPLSMFRSNLSKQRASRCNYAGFQTLHRRGHRLGNHLFFYAGIMYVSWRTGRHPCIWTNKGAAYRLLDAVFDLDIEYVDQISLGCPMHLFRQRGVFLYDERIESLISISENTSLMVDGYFCSWKYTHPIATQLRQKLKFRREILEFAVDFLHRNVPVGWNTYTFVRVGVHVRRGDCLYSRRQKHGCVVADERYFRQAMNYFIELYHRVQFIVASDDITWCQKHIKPSMFNKTDVNITFSVRHNAGHDLAILANCDHTVTTGGSYSWWAAFLANGNTVYYSMYPRDGSPMLKEGPKSDIYPPDWIGFGD